jgi:Carboxypeptidase regulatory-like domain
MRSGQVRRLFGGAVVWLALAAAVPALAAAGAISGTVTADGGGPILGVEVCATPSPEAFDTSCDETDAAGEYQLTSLPEAVYSLKFSGDRNNLKYVTEWYDDASFMNWDLFHLDGDVAVTIDAALAEGGSIAGTLTDESNGQPIAGHWACANDAEGYTTRCAQSNADGEYVINGLPSGEYIVEFEGWGETNYLREVYKDATGWGTATEVPVTVPATTEEIDAQLAPGAQILGRVVDGAGTPLNDVMVCAYERMPFEQQQCDWSDPAGNYALRALPAGTYVVSFEPGFATGVTFSKQWWQGASSPAEATPITIAPPETRAGVDGQIEGIPRPGDPGPESPGMPPATQMPIAKRPLPKCKKNFRRKLVKGKSRCVRKHKRHHHRNKSKGKSKPKR